MTHRQMGHRRRPPSSSPAVQIFGESLGTVPAAEDFDRASQLPASSILRRAGRWILAVADCGWSRSRLAAPLAGQMAAGPGLGRRGRDRVVRPSPTHPAPWCRYRSRLQRPRYAGAMTARPVHRSIPPIAPSEQPTRLAALYICTFAPRAGAPVGLVLAPASAAWPTTSRTSPSRSRSCPAGQSARRRVTPAPVLGRLGGSGRRAARAGSTYFRRTTPAFLVPASCCSDGSARRSVTWPTPQRRGPACAGTLMVISDHLRTSPAERRSSRQRRRASTRFPRHDRTYRPRPPERLPRLAAAGRPVRGRDTPRPPRPARTCRGRMPDHVSGTSAVYHILEAIAARWAGLECAACRS